jgi:rhodanese-related sulfurtransferase
MRNRSRRPSTVDCELSTPYHLPVLPTAVTHIDIRLDAPHQEDDFIAWWAEAERLLRARARPLRLELLVAGRGRYRIELGAALPGGFAIVAADRPWRDLVARRPPGSLEVTELRVFRAGKDVTTTTLRTWLAERDAGQRDFVLLDVLPARSFASNPIPGAVHLPVDDMDTARAHEAIGDDRDRAVVVSCRNPGCAASGRAVLRLEALGYTHVVEHAPGRAGFADG